MEPENKENCEEECEDSEELELRTPEEMEEILKMANIDSAEIAPIIQTLYSIFSLKEPNEEIVIVELNEQITEALKAGESLSFRGEKDEPAVFCTDNKTFEVKEAETSNTCLVVPDLKCSKEVGVEDAQGLIVEQKEVVHIYNKYIELKECQPRLSKLHTVLGPSAFKGLEYEKAIDPMIMYDWERLRNEIQASDGELKGALTEYLVAEMDGYYRLISFEFEARAMPFMLDLIEENSWAVDEVDKEVSCESLKDIIPKPVFELLFEKYADPSKTKDDGTQLYRFNQAKSCRLLAHILLSTSPVNSYPKFMEAWKVGSPDFLEPKEEYLYGIAIVRYNKQAMRKEVALFLESSLPDDLNKRLTELFKAKEKWTYEEISPYISKFATKTLDVNSILLKLTRVSMKDGVKNYSARHGK